MCFLKWSSGDCCAVSIESHGDRGRSILTEAPGDSHRLDILLSPIVICSLPLSKLSSFFFFYLFSGSPINRHFWNRYSIILLISGTNWRLFPFFN